MRIAMVQLSICVGALGDTGKSALRSTLISKSKYAGDVSVSPRFEGGFATSSAAGTVRQRDRKV